MGYWKDYEDGRTGNPLGTPWSAGYIEGENEKRRQQWNNNGGNGGGNGCGYIILIGVGLYVLISILPIVVPAAISALILASTINKFGDKILSISYLPTFTQAFKALFYTYLWYILVCTIVGFITMIVINPAFEIDQIEYDNTDLFKLGLKLFVLQIPNFLIAGAIFRRYINKYLGKAVVSYWKSTFFMSIALIVWFAIISIEYYFLAQYNPELFQQIIEKIKEIYQ
jgi:hypothetical protein